jgi:hypothetical protein
MVTRLIMRDHSSKSCLGPQKMNLCLTPHGESHPLLAQIPLTVSPFISLPTAKTLPYTYKTLPSTLPPSSTGKTATATDEKPRYVVSASGHAAHPDDIVASCKILQEYLDKVQDDADRVLNEWDEGIKARELAEKRRVAPGWLDSDARLLKPQRKEDNNLVKQSTVPQAQASLMDASGQSSDIPTLGDYNNTEGEELDRAFGGLGL